MLKIAIIGGGINGFCCGVKLAEHFGDKAKVTVLSEEFTPNTTGDGSAGLWGPFLCGNTSERKIAQWSKESHDFFKELWVSESAGKAGICLTPCFRVTTETVGLDCFWSNIVFGYQKMSPTELKKLCDEHKKNYTEGCYFTTFTTEPIKLLVYLMDRFEKAGGVVQKQKVTDLGKFVRETDFSVVINCTGLGSKYIVPDDSMYAIRGQVTRVKAPWMYYIFLDESDDGNYIIPNCESVVLGGTHQVHDYNTIPTEPDRQFIMNGCRNLVPGIRYATHIKDWVGLRPGRDSIRLEKQITENGKILIHNYGHGGSGVTLAWGCATDVLNLLINNRSKL